MDHCIRVGCFGVMEFCAVMDATGIEKRNRMEEERVVKDDERVFMVYRCSRCHQIQFLANNSMDNFLTKRTLIP